MLLLFAKAFNDFEIEMIGEMEITYLIFIPGGKVRTEGLKKITRHLLPVITLCSGVLVLDQVCSLKTYSSFPLNTEENKLDVSIFM